MQNLQNIPGDTDLDNPLGDDRVPGEENRSGQNSYPLPTDKIPSAPVEEPNGEMPINENPREPQRIMSSFTISD